MYGFAIDVANTKYQAEVAQVSRDWALALLQEERERSDRVRVWMHQALEEEAWGGMHLTCGCPLSENARWRSMPVIRVRGFMRAISHWVEQHATDEGVTVLAFISSVSPEEAGREVHNWSELKHFFAEVDDEVGVAFEERDRAREQLIRDNEAGRF